MDFMTEVDKLIPVSPENKLNWKETEASLFGVFFPEMKSTEQNPKFHGEGNVCTHTRMVCTEITKLQEFRELDQTQRIGLFTAWNGTLFECTLRGMQP